MSDDDNLELDNELAKSIEKLVDEETSVAKAFVNRNVSEYVRTDKYNAGHTSDSPISSKTQAIPSIPSRNIVLKKDKDDLDDILSEEDDDEFEEDIIVKRSDNKTRDNDIGNKATRNSSTNRNDNSKNNTKKKKLDSKSKIVIVGIIAVVLMTIVGILVVALISNNHKKNSYDYNYSKGIEYYNNSDYLSAIPYLEKAVADSTAKKNVDLKFKLYECYVAQSNMNKAVEVLKDVLSYDKYNEKAITTLSSYYSSNKEGDKLTELIEKYRGTDAEKYLLAYEVNEPTASQAAGNYNDTVELTLNSDSNNKIYYTIDGSDPTVKSTLYSSTITIEKGTTTVKAISVNSIGTCSVIVELKYVVDYKIPDAPDITPATGTYESGQIIEITNINEGDKAYYTLDGSTPNAKSTEYTEGFEMPEGNTVVSAYIVSQYGLESSVARRNYNVATTKIYTFDEAVELLKTQMKIKKEMNSDGTSADGGTATFVYQTKKTIANVEMYYIRYDSRKNGVTSTVGYYGVALKTGQCYKVTESGSTFIATGY